MSKGPLRSAGAKRRSSRSHAGAVADGTVELENAGTVAWRERHLPRPTTGSTCRGNPIVWDGDRNGSAAARARRARAAVDAPRARADPARPLPARLRPRRRGRAPGSRSSADAPLDDRRRGAAARRRAARRAPGRRRAGGRLAGARRVPRTPKATASSPVRSPGRAGGTPAASRARALRAGPRPAVPASRRRCSARRCWPASSSSGSPTSPGCPPSPRRATSRGSTTAGSCCSVRR